MNKTQEALKLALEALSPWAGEDANHTEQYAAYHAIREALAEQETVSPGGGHVPAVPVAVYGYCPECGGAGVMRERRPNGDDKCTNGHKYPSSKALAEQPAQQEPVAYVQHWCTYCQGHNAHNCQFNTRLPRVHTYTTNNTSPPASKPWVGLTEAEHTQIAVECGCMSADWVFYGATVERILKEKNS